MNASVLLLRIVALTFLAIAGAPLAQADDRTQALFGDELQRQTEIYRSKGADRPEGYVINRSLESYSMTLPSEFSVSLAELGESDRWLDIGAGEGRAILDYCSGTYEGSHWLGAAHGAKKARAVAMSIEDRRTSEWHEAARSMDAEQLRYLFGRSLSQYTNEELGRFRMITDVLGGFSYTDNLARFTAKALALLEVKGVFYTVLQDVHEERGSNKPFYPDAPFLTEITDTDGSALKVCSWLKRIGCVQVSCEYKADFNPPVEVYRIEKVCENVTVPPLATVHYQAGTPPERRFRAGRPPAKQEAMSKQ